MQLKPTTQHIKEMKYKQNKNLKSWKLMFLIGRSKTLYDSKKTRTIIMT